MRPCMFSVFQVTSKSVSFSQTFAIQLHLFSIFLRYFRYFINSVFSSDTLDTSFIHYFPQILPSRALYLPPLPILANSQSPFRSLLRRVVTPSPSFPRATSVHGQFNNFEPWAPKPADREQFRFSTFNPPCQPASDLSSLSIFSASAANQAG